MRGGGQRRRRREELLLGPFECPPQISADRFTHSLTLFLPPKFFLSSYIHHLSASPFARHPVWSRRTKQLGLRLRVHLAEHSFLPYEGTRRTIDPIPHKGLGVQWRARRTHKPERIVEREKKMRRVDAKLFQVTRGHQTSSFRASRPWQHTGDMCDCFPPFLPVASPPLCASALFLQLVPHA